MEDAINREFDKFERIVEKYYLKEKEDKALECVEWARGYATDFPQQRDIDEATRLAKKIGKYISDQGKTYYEAARDRLVKKLLQIPLEIN